MLFFSSASSFLCFSTRDYSGAGGGGAGGARRGYARGQRVLPAGRDLEQQAAVHQGLVTLCYYCALFYGDYLNEINDGAVANMFYYKYYNMPPTFVATWNVHVMRSCKRGLMVLACIGCPDR